MDGFATFHASDFPCTQGYGIKGSHLPNSFHFNRYHQTARQSQVASNRVDTLLPPRTGGRFLTPSLTPGVDKAFHLANQMDRGNRLIHCGCNLHLLDD